MLSRVGRDESGITLVEVMIAGAMASIIATAFLVIFSAFSSNVSLEEARAAALTEVQETASNLAAELRQAVPLSKDGSSAVARLESSWASPELIFYSDRAAGSPGPERYRYYTSACTATHCNLLREVTVADTPGPPWTFTGTPTTKIVVTNLMVGGAPLFRGANWASGAEVLTTSCNLVTPCRMSLIQITLRVDPDRNIVAEEPVQVRHEVRMRNAS